LPIIAMTAAVMQEDRERCHAAGMTDFIAKPIDPDEMTRVLLKWVKPGASGWLQPCGAHADNVDHGICADAAPILPDSLAGFDLETALRRLAGNRGLLASLLLDFAAEHANTAAQLGALLQAGERKQAAALLHTVKGIAANLGATTLAEVAQQLEQELKASGESPSRQAFADTLAATLAAIAAHVAPPPAADDQSIDRQALAQVLKRLVPYLQEQELVPEALMESLHGFARQIPSDTEPAGLSLARLVRQLDHFDHDGALASVTQLAAALGVVLENDGL